MQHNSTFQYDFKIYDVIGYAPYNEDFPDLNSELNFNNGDFITYFDLREVHKADCLKLAINASQ
ncbi:MAG: hypothetical protein EHM47_12690 [Ignavibacteriales bacterium]|nr:MAG: hypothetical protein EHM47_12690 [Ignavibacteriales bacterium]